MPLSNTDAKKEILTLFLNAVAATSGGSPDISGIDIDYPDLKSLKPSTQDNWLRVNFQHVTGSQTTLRGVTGEGRFNRTGLVTVQIFKVFGKGLVLGNQIAKIIMDAYEGKATLNGAWFRNIRQNEIGVSDDWFQINILIEFTYDEVK